jgi:uncharacterized membrane protein YjjP (DUF1212 family)
MAEPAQVLSVVAAAGEVLLRSGAEVSRVEDTLARLALAYGIEEAEIYATPTGIFITLGAEHHLSAVRRVNNRTFCLDRVSAINALSREVTASPIPPAEALERIRAIAAQPPPVPGWTEPFFSALAAAACTMLVGGTLSDFLPALVANVVVQWVQRSAVTHLRLPDAIGDYAAGATAVLCALAAAAWLGADFTPVVAGGIMVLVPGIAFTISVRDAMAGDLSSASARGLEAVMKAAALASGVASALFISGRL